MSPETEKSDPPNPGGAGCGTSMGNGGTCGVGMDMCGVCRQVKALHLRNSRMDVSGIQSRLESLNSHPEYSLLDLLAAKSDNVQRKHNPV